MTEAKLDERSGCHKTDRINQSEAHRSHPTKATVIQQQFAVIVGEASNFPVASQLIPLTALVDMQK